MPVLYRVFPYVESSADDEPGGALYIPAQGNGRLDNPGIYSVLYLSDSPSGAIAEAFGRFPEWTPAMLEGGSATKGSVRAIATYSLPEEAPVCDLDDPQRLIALDLRPSHVVTRDYDRSRIWARRIWDQRKWSGVRWWSYYDPRWASFGLWDATKLRLDRVRELRIADPELVEASRIIIRVIGERKKTSSASRYPRENPSTRD